VLGTRYPLPVIIATFGIGNTLSLSVFERTREATRAEIIAALSR
jgi:hypothetical protein